MKKTVTKEGIGGCRKITQEALKVAKNSVINGKEKEAKEITGMVENYLSDSEYFEKAGDFVNAFAAINYCHGWLDAGVRLGIFNVKDSRFFTVR